MKTGAPAGGFTIPELGPSLGRLVAPPPAPPGSPAPWSSVDDLRIAFVSQLFGLAGDARRWAREGDRELVFSTLNRDAWVAAWQATIEAVAGRAAETIGARLAAAAREACMPRRQMKLLSLDAEGRRALSARLGTGTPALRESLDELERAAHSARATHAPASAIRAWEDVLLRTARRQEAAWLALEAALAEEWRIWGREVEAVRGWRRPLWPLVATGVALFSLAAWAGLVLGGYLPVPDLLRPAVEWVWTRWN
jgi:hypothetical protein